MRLGDPRLRGDDKSQERGGVFPHPLTNDYFFLQAFLAGAFLQAFVHLQADLQNFT